MSPSQVTGPDFYDPSLIQSPSLKSKALPEIKVLCISFMSVTSHIKSSGSQVSRQMTSSQVTSPHFHNAIHTLVQVCSFA